MVIRAYSNNKLIYKWRYYSETVLNDDIDRLIARGYHILVGVK